MYFLTLRINRILAIDYSHPFRLAPHPSPAYRVFNNVILGLDPRIQTTPLPWIPAFAGMTIYRLLAPSWKGTGGWAPSKVISPLSS